MSLFLGNLSSRTRRDELEHVFRRFGRCSVQLKDGYGFAVYEFPPNAAKALRALRGKIICGEPIILSWSNKQPRPFQRFPRGARSYEPRYGKNSTREDYFDRRFESNGRNSKMGIKQPVSDDKRHSSAEESSYNQNIVQDNVGDKHPDVGKDFMDEAGSVEPNQVDNDRWGQDIVEPSNENEFENGLEFDRYEPYHSRENIDEDDNSDMRNSQDETVKDRTDAANSNYFHDSRSRQTCYNCGELGHKLRNCPRDSASRGKRFSRFERRQDDLYYRSRAGYELERLRSTSRGRMPPVRDAIPMRRHMIDRNENKSLRENYKLKGRGGREDETPRRPLLKKARRSVSSPLHSDCPAPRSRSHSRSSKSLSRPRPRSTSASSRSRCSPFASKSSSMSHYSRSKSSHPRSKSSSPTSLSLSVSLGCPIPSSPNKMQINHRGSFEKATTPESKEVLLNDNSILENDTSVVKNENAISSFKLEADMDEVHPHLMNEKALLEKGASNGGDLSQQSIKEENELGRSAGMAAELIPTTGVQPKVPSSSCSRNLLSISSEEMYKVMKRYGMDTEGNDSSVDNHFGSSRLWPWEIVYYRRLRKGPISVENYARRIAQNREFGIVDKYVRSSSGWEELDEAAS